MNIESLFRILTTRWPWILAAMVLTLAVAFLAAQRLAPEYRASTSIVLDFPTNGPLTASNAGRQLGSDYIMTQVDIIRSPRVARRVLAELDGTTRQELIKAYLAPGTIIPNEAQSSKLVAQLRENVVVTPSRDSRVIFIDFKFSSPDATAAVANAFAKVYIDVSLELTVQPATRQAAWFDDQISTLRARLETEQSELSAYQKQAGIINLDERLDSETKRLDQLSASLVEAQARTFDMRSRQLGHRHPEYQRAIKRELSIVNALDAQREKLFELKLKRDQITLLAQDLDSARTTYNTALERMYEAKLESQLSQSNASVLSTAVAPPKEQTNFTMIYLAALLLGFFGGLALAIFVELFDRRLHNEQDVNDVLKLPVLGSI